MNSLKINGLIDGKRKNIEYGLGIYGEDDIRENTDENEFMNKYFGNENDNSDNNNSNNNDDNNSSNNNNRNYIISI